MNPAEHIYCSRSAISPASHCLCSNYPAVLHISSITSASNGCRYSTQSVSHSSTFGPCNTFQYGLPWHIFYIQLLTPFYLCVQLSHAVIGYFITGSPSGIMHRMALQHCSQTSFPSTADSHHVDTSHCPLCLLPAVRWLLPHSWEPLPRSTVKWESKTPLALGGCLKKSGDVCARMEGCYLPYKGTIQQKITARTGNRVCLSNPSLSCWLTSRDTFPQAALQAGSS